MAGSGSSMGMPCKIMRITVSESQVGHRLVGMGKRYGRALTANSFEAYARSIAPGIGINLLSKS